MKKMLKKLIRNEKGQALPMVLIMIVVSGLILAPLLSYTSSSLKVSKTYENIADEFYAADAGIEDGRWQIKHNHLEDLFGNYERYNYDQVYHYPISYPVEANDIDVDVSIENIWIPLGIGEPSNSEAEALINAGKLIVTGGVSAELTQQVNIYYYYEEGDPTLTVTSIGVWLPPGFNYDEDGTCSLEIWLDADPSLDYSRQIVPHKGGEAAIWNFPSPISFSSLPEVSELETPRACTFTFNFESSQTTRSPEAVAWVTTSGAADIPYAWDADVRVFHITSQAGGDDGTTIDAYSIQTELRELGSAISGDYRAVGNTLMVDDDPWRNPPIRETLLDYSDATIDDIPDNAQVDGAYLYWSAWVIAGSTQTQLFYDSCEEIEAYWDDGDDWDVYEDYDWWTGSYIYAYEAHHDRGNSDSDRELEMEDAIELSMYDAGEVTLSLEYWKGGNLEDSDQLLYSFRNSSGWSDWSFVFYGDGWSHGASDYAKTFTVAIPEDYLTDNFRVKFRIESFSNSGWGGEEICYIDNIEIIAEEETVADTEAVFKIDNQVVFYEEDEHGELTVPATGPSGSIYAKDVEVLDNPGSGGYSYCCRKDVTTLIQTFADHGNADYTLGHVNGSTDSQWSYAGWSLVVIYSSPDTKRHQLYIFDQTRGHFMHIAPNTDGETFYIGNFLVPDPVPGETIAAKITCFVGDGDDYYSGDFIALNPPDFDFGYQIPDSYKLWDSITLPPGPVSPYMPNNAASPNNVWNSRSLVFGGSEIDGVDIDTFYVPWGSPPSSGLLKPGDSSAEIVLNFAGYNQRDAELINFLYIIISFRSSTVTGGTISYLVE
ncbi:MAG: hypothetical protein PVJ61_02610 [Dehalococcoidia bacterium]|jgi:hypothetical protein